MKDTQIRAPVALVAVYVAALTQPAHPYLGAALVAVTIWDEMLRPWLRRFPAAWREERQNAVFPLLRADKRAGGLLDLIGTVVFIMLLAGGVKLALRAILG